MQTPALPIWLQRLYELLFLLLPWSVEWSFGAWSLNIPAEPLLALAAAGVALALFRRPFPASLPALAWLSLGWIGWMAVAAVFSTLPVVSWKYWLVEAGHWWVFFVGLLCWPQLWPRLVRVFAWSMTGMVVYVIGHHAFYHFRPDQAVLAPMPFFADHTVYSAVLAMLLLVFPRPLPQWMRAGWGASLLLAASRAAWLSLLLAGLAGLALYFRLKWRWWVLAGALALGGVFFLRVKIATSLAGDVSSQERLNRYACAWRMAADRPWAGFGPGTFQFQYFSYQDPAGMTRISRTTPVKKRGPDNYGRGGGAHSEYLQALAELGWPGLAAWLLLTGAAVCAGAGQYRRPPRRADILLILLALLSFLLHGLVNNFLHDARVAALVWGAMALLANSNTEHGIIFQSAGALRGR